MIQEVSRRAPPKTITSGKRSPGRAVLGRLSQPCSVTPSDVGSLTSSMPLPGRATSASRAGSAPHGRKRKRCSIGSRTKLQPAENNRLVNERSKDRFFIGVNLTKTADHGPPEDGYTISESLFRVDRSRTPLDAEKAPKVHAREIAPELLRPTMSANGLLRRQRIRAGELVEQVDGFSAAGQLANRFLEFLRPQRLGLLADHLFKLRFELRVGEGLAHRV